MPKLIKKRKFRLYSVSKKSSRLGVEFDLVPFDTDAINEDFEIDEDGIEGALTVLANDLYGRDAKNCWFPVESNGNSDKPEIFRFAIDRVNRLTIPSIIESIDPGSEDHRYYIIVNGKRTKYDWIVASEYTVYSCTDASLLMPLP